MGGGAVDDTDIGIRSWDIGISANILILTEYINYYINDQSNQIKHYISPTGYLVNMNCTQSGNRQPFVDIIGGKRDARSRHYQQQTTKHELINSVDNESRQKMASPVCLMTDKSA